MLAVEELTNLIKKINEKQYIEKYKAQLNLPEIAPDFILGEYLERYLGYFHDYIEIFINFDTILYII